MKLHNKRDKFKKQIKILNTDLNIKPSGYKPVTLTLKLKTSGKLVTRNF